MLEVPSEKGRIVFLDGLRGIAILLVLLYHTYARWPDLYPYRDIFSENHILRNGKLGVQLFFMISGFVIFMTIQKCAGFRDFMLRRWLRLFPAMFVCSLFVFSTAPLFPERPSGAPGLDSLIPGLLFIDAEWFRQLGFEYKILEGAFWSLFVEVKFYIIFGIVFFILGGRSAIVLTFSMFLLAKVLRYIVNVFNIEDGVLVSFKNVLDLTGASFFGWFAAGALFFLFFQSQNRKLLGAAIAVGLISATTNGPDLSARISASIIFGVFALSLCVPSIREIVSQKVFIFMGFISYPLYLLHENMLVAMIVKVGRVAPAMPPILIPALPLLAVILFAWIIASYVEPWATRLLRPAYEKFRVFIGVKRAVALKPI